MYNPVRSLTSIVYSLILLGGYQSGLQITPREIKPPSSVTEFLRGYVDRSPFGVDESTRFSAEHVPGANLVVVYLSGNTWCGSGGCTLLILLPSRSSFELVGKVTGVSLPVKSLESSHHTLPDIEVNVKGGGIKKSFRAVLLFNGAHYPSSPFFPPAKRTSGKVGHVLIGENVVGIALRK